MASDATDALQTKLHSMTKQMAEFTALYESVTTDQQLRETHIQKQLDDYQHNIEGKMSTIELMLTDFENILTQAGAARWRLAAEKALSQGQEHLRAMQQITDTFDAQVQTACYSIENTCEEAATRFHAAAQQLQLEELQKATQYTSTALDKVSTDAVKKISAVAKLFHWERFGMAVIVALLSALVTGMFLNDETPIESHKKAMAERQAGRVLMAAWPNLEESERERINQVATL